MGYSKPNLIGDEIFSSGGTLTTSGNDEEWTVPNSKLGVNLMMEFITAGAFQINDATGYASFSAGDKFTLTGVGFTKLKFQTSGTQVRFYGVSV